MKRPDPFTHYATVEFTIYKMDSRYVPYETENVEITTTEAAGDMDVAEYLDLVRFDMIELPKEVKAMGEHQCARIKAELWGHFGSYETAYGTEYGADFELRNEQVQIRAITA